MSQSQLKTNDHRSLTFVLIALVGITLIYQLRPFLDDAQFAWISVPSYSIIPGTLVVFATVLAIKLKRMNHYQAKAYFLFAIGVACWFVAEQLWAAYDHVWEGEPFPSEADAFYIAAYPFLFAFLMISLKPARKSISKNVLFFAIALSAAFLIPSFSITFSDMEGELPFDTAVALAYPIASSVLLVPAIIGIMFLFKLETNYSWMLMLFGFISYIIADTFFLFVIVDGSYYDGHPTDLVYLYSFLLFIFSLSNRLKSINEKTDSRQTIFYSEKIKFETIGKFGVPLTLVIVSMVVIISMIHSVYFEDEETFSLQNFMLGIVALLGVFIVLIVTINKNLTKLVHMRTEELQEQKNNLENLVEEKTHELLKQERLSAIGELSGRLAHDLRNPLSVMKMSVDLLAQQPADKKISDPDVVKRIDLIDKSITRISHQVDDVLGYVRNSPLKLSTLSVHDLLKTSIDKINVPSNVEIIISDKDTSINCDPVKIDAVFINLIVNSIQAMPDSGGQININISENKDNVKLEFSDSGDGIPEHIIDKIFEPLFTTKQKGTGLGLASCKNIIEQHQGIISVKNNPTTFTIEMPKLLTQEVKIETP
ncbi:HAMP domain-containing histidine kinase [Candidatus Nitrosopumilus sp. SW]|uniref:sensor histidine kinase n=1 Tax=Candidatus Nitrosopumilus sp. SW TaxID=2508726 RepID=UPI001151E620|nr:HAMP domain-containing sensor histidine kinase [Candidatus Nitrosopumilus sp. SW]QDI88752.1 HAMP domain-containing histidine kinase [Candidatus Nitrosopumilus sp. SW]